MWSEWLARTLKPRPVRAAARPSVAVAEEPADEATAAGEADAAPVPEDCALPPHEAAPARAASVARGSL